MINESSLSEKLTSVLYASEKNCVLFWKGTKFHSRGRKEELQELRRKRLAITATDVYKLKTAAKITTCELTYPLTSN